ncbi:MAG: cation:dicarboxylase symporter family transporter [Bacteroidia bacterium]|nr:cation:dicarboxylase symporter family transporter [Bacteroidia bacterium]MDW8345494.1 cation:dicarboxylase symporter family transporter [Bacteroidia bacterium]
MKKPKLTTQIFLGMLLGVIVGYLYREFNPEKAVYQTFVDNVKILSDIFLRLIKMIIAPLVFSTLVVGIAKLGDFKTVGRIGLKTIIYFQIATILALSLGLILVNLARPGYLMHIELPAQGSEVGISTQKTTLSAFITHIFPKSVIESMANNDILPIVVFSLFFGIATAAIGEQGQIIIRFMDAVAQVMFKITHYVMKFAPFGVFGAISAVVCMQGIGILKGYLYLIICFFAGLLVFIFLILQIICWIVKIPFWRLIQHVKEPIILAFSTASSEAAFPKTVEGLEKFGCSSRIVTFVLPLGYSFNLDGSIMYMTFASVFIAQAYNISLTLTQQITMMLTLLITSKGMAGVPRASLVVIAGTCAMFGIPVEGLLILLGVDQILDMGRSATNVIGNAVATAVVSKWEKEL